MSNSKKETKTKKETVPANVDRETGEIFETAPAPDIASGSYDPFETQTEYKATSFPFFDFKGENKTIEGIYLGQGPTFKTKNSRDKFFTIALLEKQSRSIRLVTASKMIDSEVIQKLEAGKWMLKITSFGKKESSTGDDYNSYGIEKAALKQPYEISTDLKNSLQVEIDTTQEK